MKEQMVRATLKSTYGYFNARRGIKENFGPGENILIPQGLAYSLGIPYQPAEAVGKAPAETDQPTETGVENAEEREAPGEHPDDDLSILNLSSATLAALLAAGFTTFASIAAATDESLIAVKGVGAQTASRIKAVVQEQVG